MTIHILNTSGEHLVTCSLGELLAGTAGLDGEALGRLSPGEAIEISHGGRVFVVERPAHPTLGGFLRDCAADCLEGRS